MGFAERFKALREERGLTLLEIAKQMGVSEPTVQRWESGNIKQVRYGRIEKLASILGTTPAYLYGYEGEEPQPVKLTKEEEQFLVILRQLSPQGRAAAAQMLKSLADFQAQAAADRD